ncbi:MAG: hypothetical protein DI539_06750 [Flavobacterium psychrophilum]|nr:MAG: hypothetical protein DI539_06750 [Flavobacterium psychrophilum]
MKTITFYVAGLLCLLTTKALSQEKKLTFEQRAREISQNIEAITKQQKDSLKIEVEAVNVKLDNKEITEEQAEAQKQQYAEKRAKNIETKVAVEQGRLDQLVKDKVDGKVAYKNHTIHGISFISYEKDDDDDTTKVWVNRYDYKRTTSQFVFALGINRLMTDGKVDTSNFEDRSDFYEWGVAWNSRIFKNNNLLHFKYGLSLQYNNLRPKDDKIFVADGDKTILVDSGRNLDKVRLRYVNLVVPMHLEFDFTPKKVNGDKVYYPIQKSFRLGVGGYAGVNVKEKQILKYKNDDGNRVKDKTKGDFNVNDFTYGLSAYVGYRGISVYAKYDLQPVFNNNDIDQNNFSLGLRFDFN